MAPSSRARGSNTPRVAAALFLADVPFAVLMPVALAHLRRTGELPMTPFGFRAFSGPFERLGHQPFMALGVGLMAVAAVDAVAAVGLWRGERSGADLGLAVTPAATALGLGFALPFLLVPIPIRAALALAARRRLGRDPQARWPG
jgi:hypothetical protein